MMSLEKFFTVTLCLIFIIHIILGNPSQCYRCNSMDGERCNDPLNTTVTEKWNCSHLQRATSHPWVNGDRERSAHGSTIICFKLTFNFDGEKQTIRGCEYDELDNKTFCNYYGRLSDAYSNVTNLKCNTCGADLCNSSVAIHIYFFPFICGLIQRFI